ncbi:AfsR/SARP family transcriptional regulator [Streptomyces triticirhizae]|uniref:AfsR/SARP family transcriptional regulator n=1 Tax=Streptomyces triticirhizae TaxID=2483353 RepID=UPI0013155B72|nr:AfsR/SARP family transcriptional regulator [Streptomyces triticirhizae]
MRTVLALLAARRGQVVSLGTFAEELWGSRLPRRPETTVRTHIYHLRTMLERDCPVPVGQGTLATGSSGYLLRATEEQVDAEVFAATAERGRTALVAGDTRRAAVLLRQALALWRGPALSDVAAGPALSGHLRYLTDLRLRTLELRIDADMALGEHRELVPELRGLLAAHPLHEYFHRRLIETLWASGRRSEALAAYRSLRALLAEELGIDPSPEVQRLHAELLALRPVA